MRPLSLTVRGFRSYAASHTFDFADRRLVGIVGPIGSGKSSLLDAIAFALYGKTPTVAAGTRSLINQRAAVGQVELWFEADGRTWRAVRALRSKGQSEHALYRHASHDEGSERHEEVLGAEPVTQRVEQLLGLDFAAFQRSVLLAQNQFAGFLRARPGERDAVLKGVFGFERVEAMHAMAKARRDAAARDLEELERTRKEVEADRLALEEARTAHVAAADRAAVLDQAAQAVADADVAIAAATAEEQQSRARRAELDELARRLPDRAATATLLEAARTAAARLEAARTEAAAAAEAVAAAEAGLAGAVEETGGREALSEAGVAADRAADRAAAVQRAAAELEAAQAAAEDAGKALTAAQQAAEKAEQARADAEAARDAARGERRAAEEALHEGRHADAAAELRTTLAAGEPCPVCQQPVATLPKAGRRPGLAAAGKAVDKAARAEERTETKVAAAAAQATTAAGDLAAAKERAGAAGVAVAAARERLTAARAAHEEAVATAAGLLGEGDAGALLAAARERLGAAEHAAAVARERQQAAAAAVDGARRAGEESREALRKLATEVATLAVRIGSDLDVSPEADEVAVGLDKLRSLWEDAAASADDAVQAARQRRTELEEGRAKLLQGLGLEPQDDFAAAVAAARQQAATLAGRIEVLEQRVARVAELEARNEELVSRLATYRVLAEDLAPSRFLKYLLDEERAALADLGSERFELLSGGRYRFTAGFDIVDLAAADAVRRADSLSGGETFLASLALALALADMVTRRGGRLDAFFLDEGFGSLDAEHLDLAMEGIERLVAEGPDRLVVLVSHVPEMRHRIEDLIILDKEPATGDTIVRQA